MVAAVAGGLEEAHRAGCDQASRWLSVEVDPPVDAVVTSAGGWPYDCDFVQALKAIFNIQGILRPGGAILWVAECPQGMKEGFLHWARIASDDELEASVRRSYNLAGHNTIMLRALLRRARVAMLSSLPEDALTALGVVPVRTLGEGMDWLRSCTPPGSRVAIIPHANISHAFSSEIESRP